MNGEAKKGDTMGITDKFKDLAENAVEKLGGSDKAKEAVDAAGDKADDATDSKYSTYVDKGQDAAKSGIDQFDNNEQ
jgi:hypothetical protein